MIEFFCPVLELAILLPGLLLAYLPMKQYLKLPPLKLAAIMLPLTLLLCVLGGAVSFFLSVNTRLLFFPLGAVAAAAYIHSLRITRWKSVSVFLAVCGVFSCVCSVAYVIDVTLSMGATSPWFSIKTSLLFHLMCWLLVLLVWYPATHMARDLLEDEAFAGTWYLFWILPILFIVLNCVLTPIHPELMFYGRFMSMYVTNSLALLFLLLLFYYMFYLMASGLNQNDRLRQENQFLSMQQARYEQLKTAIAQTREARHDMRHHLNILQNLIEKNEWEKAKQYLSEIQDNFPDANLNLCDNLAVDSVASHYGRLCLRHHIPFTFQLDLPEKLPVPEMDLCVVLSNLLENALEASLKQPLSRRNILAQACLHSEHVILLTVENYFDGTVREKDGVFQSSKRKGDGVGVQSVRRIAEKSGGYSRIFYENGTFCANVMLRTGKNNAKT